MLPSELLWATLASLVVRISCSNDFVTSKFPSQFEQGDTAEFYWDNLDGYIAGIRVYSPAGNSDPDSTSNADWILEPNCPDSDSDSSCTAYANNGSAHFDGSLSNGTQVPLGSGYELVLLWTDSQSYDDIDDDTSEVRSPTFSIVPGASGDDAGSDGGSSGLSKGEKAGIAIAVILVVMFLILMLWWRLTKERRHNSRRRRGMKRQAERDEEEGHGHDHRWIPAAAKGLGRRKEARESWSAGPTNLPEKQGLTASVGPGQRDGADREGRLYVDDKAELSSDHAGGPPRVGDRSQPGAARAPLAPVELPAESVRGMGAASQPRAAVPVFAYDPRPSYALRTPASQYAEPHEVSPLTPAVDGAAALGPQDDLVSPLTPISRKPVRVSVRGAAEGTR